MTDGLPRRGGYLSVEDDVVLPLPLMGGLPRSVHVFDEAQLLAINAALATRRPLLLRGEPGTGKSQLGRAAAVALGRAFLYHPVDQRTDTRDLLWRLDAISRLARAQVVGAIPPREGETLEGLLELRNFVIPGPLWWSYEPDEAARQAARAKAPEPWCRPEGTTDDEHRRRISEGVVLLIDEIDKADPSVPNGLLDALGHGSFQAVEGLARVSLQEHGPPRAPLVVITTNRERVLPDAFLRRCVVLTLGLPDDGLQDFLVRRGRAHFAERAEDDLLQEAARQLVDDRRRARERRVQPPGLAEYLDLLSAVLEQVDEPPAQVALLRQLRAFFFDKHPDERGP